jgi:hypothetical protein
MQDYSSSLRRMASAALQAEHQPRRTYARLRLGVMARLLTLDGEQWVTLIDLSQGGARVALGASGKVTGGLLRWLGYEAFGDPVWQAGDELALHFDEPIASDWLIETRRRAPAELDYEVYARRVAREWVGGRAVLGTDR